MTQKTGYEINGEVVETLKELASIIGVDKISQKDVEKKYADQVNIVDLADEEWENQVHKKEVPEEKHPMERHELSPDEVFTALTDEDRENLKKVDPSEIKSAFPEFEDLDELKEFIKDIDTPTLEYLATGLGVEWNPTYHANIHRMRIAMGIQKHFFPELFVPKEAKKSKAKYGDYSTTDLFKMASEKDIEVTKTGNEPIDRMKVIMELKKNGVLKA